MSIYYYAVDDVNEEYFTAPDMFSVNNPGIYYPGNPFPNMVVMKNIQGSFFKIKNDCSCDIPPSDEYRNVTDEVYKELMDEFPDYKFEIRE